VAIVLSFWTDLTADNRIARLDASSLRNSSLVAHSISRIVSYRTLEEANIFPPMTASSPHKNVIFDMYSASFAAHRHDGTVKQNRPEGTLTN
jgi:hypothetical protein